MDTNLLTWAKMEGPGRKEKKAARQEARKQRRIEKSTGLEYEVRVMPRDKRLAKKMMMSESQKSKP
jgi:hypothetical protein